MDSTMINTLAFPDTCAEADERALMVRVAAGDQQAFGIVYDRHCRSVLAVVTSVLRDPSQSEEVTQEVFVEAWRQAPRFDVARGRLGSWLTTMARRRAIDRVRSEQASRNRTRVVASRSQAIAYDDVQELIGLAEEHGDVRRALGLVSEVQRQAITLAFFGDRTYSEVARELNVPLPTVKTRIRDGMRHMRSELTATAALA
ncbi:MAG: RNA polymerase sigma-70 factor (ECF subfamily) [Glaciecola sp.]|jgi:RNA polymerase sigma-70 factor (ECF subfamily)